MFILRKMDVGATPPIDYMPAKSGESYALGEALKVASGVVTLCSGAVKPQYVCVGKAKDGGVPCIRVQDYMTFETTLAAAPAENATLGVGDKATIHTDGAQITATTTNGVAEIVELDGTTVGSRAVVKF